MARVTVEDCIVKVPNRFELVLLAAQRARDISAGAPIAVERDNDKNPVVALREIGEGTLDLEHLKTVLVQNLQKHAEIDEPEDEELDAILAERDVADETDAPAEEEELREDVLSVHEDVDSDEDEMEAETAEGGDEGEDAVDEPAR